MQAKKMPQKIAILLRGKKPKSLPGGISRKERQKFKSLKVFAGKINSRKLSPKQRRLKAQVEKEIANLRKRSNSAEYFKYFNNFFANLPGGYRYRAMEPERRTAEGVTKSIKPSELLERQTYGEFWDTIDKAIKITGIKVEDIKTAMKKWRNSNPKEHDKNLVQFHRLIAPIYIELRVFGYKHYPDLTS